MNGDRPVHDKRLIYTEAICFTWYTNIEKVKMFRVLGT